MTFKTIALAYIIGGLTFLPLVTASILLLAWILAPRLQHPTHTSSTSAITSDKSGEDLNRDDDRRSREHSLQDNTASGTFAVLRRYDFHAAIAALNARNNASGNSVAGAADGSIGNDISTSSSSESVYQTMYRSVFDRNRNANTARTILEENTLDPDSAVKSGRRKGPPPHVLYIVLRHGHLMLYDSPAQVEVKQVISLAHHRITLQAGNGALDEDYHDNIPESELFIKRTAIVLTPVQLPNGALQQNSDLPSAKPFFLFNSVHIEKEDFYHALLASQPSPPIPRDLDADALIKLQSTLHSSSLTPETRAINALIGRVFLALQRTDFLSTFIRGKIEKKLARIQKPSFIPLLDVRSLDLGDAGPVVSNMKLKDLNISGDLTVSADMRYNGGMSITLLAVAKLDLGTRFKTRTVDVMLKTSIQRISGTMLLRVKPPPSNRLWFCFESVPDMEIRVEPIVSDRRITYGFILRAIEERIRTAIGEGLVQPNWDDIPMPLTDTRGQLRGGLWIDAGADRFGDEATSTPSTHPLAARNEKTKSMPTLADPMSNDSSSMDLATSSDIDLSTSSAQDPKAVKRRVGARSADLANMSFTTPEKTDRVTPLPPKPLRSPSFSSLLPPPPVVAVDTAESIRADDAAYQAQALQNKKLWLLRGGTPPQQHQQRDAFEELKGVRERAENADARSITSTASNEAPSPGDFRISPSAKVSGESLIPRRRQLSESSTISSPGTRISRTDSGLSSTGSLRNQQNFQQRKTTILAATAAATNAAKTWSWNAYQRGKAATAQAQARRDNVADRIPNAPMGRGQPLPPPGVPLPGPPKQGWVGIGAPKRKPVPALPPRRSVKEDFTDEQESKDDSAHQDDETASINDDFGPWRENSGYDEERHQGEETLLDSSELGNGHHETDENGWGEAHANTDTSHTRAESSSVAAEESPDTPRGESFDQPKAKKKPPPLPTRRHLPTESPLNNSSETASLAESETGGSDNDSGSSALRVPAEAIHAVAAENATDELAHGYADDAEHIDTSAGVQVESTPAAGAGSDSAQECGKGRHSHSHLRQEVNWSPADVEAEDKFVHGEDVSEGDFEGAKGAEKSDFTQE